MSDIGFIGLTSDDGADEAYAQTHVDDGECERCAGTGLTFECTRCDCGACYEDDGSEFAGDDAKFAQGLEDDRSERYRGERDYGFRRSVA